MWFARPTIRCTPSEKCNNCIFLKTYQRLLARQLFWREFENNSLRGRLPFLQNFSPNLRKVTMQTKKCTSAFEYQDKKQVHKKLLKRRLPLNLAKLCLPSFQTHPRTSPLLYLLLNTRTPSTPHFLSTSLCKYLCAAVIHAFLFFIYFSLHHQVTRCVQKLLETFVPEHKRALKKKNN